MTFINDLFSLKGKTAAVIGGGGVLGSSMSEGLAKAGADIAVLDFHCENACKQAKHISGLGVKALPLELDVSQKS